MLAASFCSDFRVRAADGRFEHTGLNLDIRFTIGRPDVPIQFFGLPRA
jgi:hypothetical protein